MKRLILFFCLLGAAGIAQVTYDMSKRPSVVYVGTFQGTLDISQGGIIGTITNDVGAVALALGTATHAATAR